MKDKERVKYLAKKYFDRTITREEWEEVLLRLDRAKEPENIDELFRGEWVREDLPHKIPHVTWEELQKRLKSCKNQQPAKIVKPLWKWISTAAAVIALISAIWLIWGQKQNLLTYETGFGETQEILLDDGTSVTLNANSRLYWDGNWANSGVRYVELEGEAYFDVAHIEGTKEEDQKLLPFKVRTSDLIVNVIGTAFNVSNRRGETDVFLERGLVKLVLGDGKSPEKVVALEEGENDSPVRIENDEVMMKPGDLVSYSSTTNVIKKGHTTNDPTWRTGALSFRKMEFGLILTELEDLYGKRFEVEDKALLSRKVTLAVPYENWETVYKLMEVTLNLEIIEDNKNNVIKIKKKAG